MVLIIIRTKALPSQYLRNPGLKTWVTISTHPWPLGLASRCHDLKVLAINQPTKKVLAEMEKAEGKGFA